MDTSVKMKGGGSIYHETDGVSFLGDGYRWCFRNIC